MLSIKPAMVLYTVVPSSESISIRSRIFYSSFSFIASKSSSFIYPTTSFVKLSTNPSYSASPSVYRKNVANFDLSLSVDVGNARVNTFDGFSNHETGCSGTAAAFDVVLGGGGGISAPIEIGIGGSGSVIHGGL